jgi:hypothetical protein
MTESETFDFKDGQYKFYGATDEEKTELLKDIIAFANAWKTGDAFIVIGVAEKNGRKDKVTGLKTFLQDNDIQQFVNSKTNRQIRFLIYSDKGDDEDINVIHIAKDQRRPVYLTKNFASLKKEVVYIRHGSSTSEATVDEIAEMGKESARVTTPDVSLEFEFVMEAWEEQQFGPRLYGEKPKITARDYLKIYAVNHKGGLAQYLQGSVWIPMLILIRVLVERQIPRVRTLQEIEKNEPYEIEISNKFSDGASQQFMKPPPPDWHPFSPGKRLCLEELQILPYREALNGIACLIRWQISVNGGDVVQGDTKFADIPLVDKRNFHH